jgi:hypothetical protein
MSGLLVSLLDLGAGTGSVKRLRAGGPSIRRGGEVMSAGPDWRRRGAFLGRLFQGPDLLDSLSLRRMLGIVQIPRLLEVEPEVRTGTKEACKP